MDTVHVYEDMNQPFSKGYVPTVKEDVLYLTVPFTVSGSLKEDALTVNLDLGKTGDEPFVYANYQKEVTPKEYTFGEEKATAWLYQCQVNLKEDRVNGSWPVMIRATGVQKDGSEVKLEYRLFVSVTDGREPGSDGQGSSGDQAGGDQNGDQGGGGDPGGDQAGGDPGDSLGSAGGDTGALIGSSGGGASGGDTQEVLHQPKLLLETCSLSGQRLTAGSDYELELQLKNKHTTRKICNLKVTLASEENSLLPETSSAYFPEISPGGTATVKTKLHISESAQQKSTPLELQFEYEDDKGTACTGSEKTLLQVSQPVGIQMEGFQLADTLYSLDTVSGTVRVLNTGKAPLYNVQVQLQVPGLFPRESVFAGTLEAGQTGEGSMNIYVGTRDMKAVGESSQGSDEEKYGLVEGKLVLTYEDAYGETYTQEQSVTSSIAKPQLVELKVPEEAQTETNQWWIALVVLVILGLLAVIVFLAAKLRKR